MNRRAQKSDVKPDAPQSDASTESTSDPTFDLHQGLKALVIFIVIMVVLSLICILLGQFSGS